jgi:hypothetical protein
MLDDGRIFVGPDTGARHEVGDKLRVPKTSSVPVWSGRTPDWAIGVSTANCPCSAHASTAWEILTGWNLVIDRPRNHHRRRVPDNSRGAVADLTINGLVLDATGQTTHPYGPLPPHATDAPSTRQMCT